MPESVVVSDCALEIPGLVDIEGEAATVCAHPKKVGDNHKDGERRERQGGRKTLASRFKHVTDASSWSEACAGHLPGREWVHQWLVSGLVTRLSPCFGHLPSVDCRLGTRRLLAVIGLCAVVDTETLCDCPFWPTSSGRRRNVRGRCRP